MTDNSFGRRGRHARFWRLSSAFGPFLGGAHRPGQSQSGGTMPLMSFSRLALAILLLGLVSAPTHAEDAPRHWHALSLIGEPRYPADFKHFDYVNPDAPKGGLVRVADVGGFDSLNPVLYKGE